MIPNFVFVRLICGLLPALWASSEGGEVMSSQFTYESQLLDKMIRMEYKMEQMEGRMNKTQEAVHAALKDLEWILVNKTEELKELEERIDFPLVAFYATHPQDQSLDTSQKLILGTVPLNLGEGYDRHLGMFTAPVSGLYQFSAHICTYSGNAFHYYIMVDGSIITESTKHNTAAYDCASSVVITQINKGQRAWIQSASGSASTTQLYDTSYHRSSFSGVLLHR